MKKIILSFFLMLPLLSMAGLPFYIPTEEMYNKFIKTKTVVIIDKDDEYSKHLQSIVESNWEITETIFVEAKVISEEKDKYQDKSEFSFLLIQDFGKFKMMYLTMDIRDGGKAVFKDAITWSVSNAKPTTCFTHEAEVKKDLLKIICCLNKKGEDYWNWKSIPQELKTKTLYIPEDFILPKGKDNIANQYDYKFEIVSKEEASKAIMENRKDFMYFDFADYDIGNQAGFVTIVDAETGNILYCMASGVGRAPAANFTYKNFLRIQMNIKKYSK